MKRITDRLLQKYYLGQCTEEEQSAVEQWLASEQFDEPLDLPDRVKPIHKQQMWQAISEDLDLPRGRKVPLYRKMMRYAAAACAVFGLGTALFMAYHDGDAGEQFAFNNMGTVVAKEVKTPLFDFTLLPGTTAELNTRLDGMAGDMAFCGAMTLVNNRDQSVALRLESSCESEQQDISKTANLKAGGKYILFQIDIVRDNETFIVTEEDLKTRALSPALRGMALKISNSI